MEYHMHHHGGWGRHHHGFGRRMWRPYGYPFFRPWYWRPRGGCCGPLFFMLLLAMILPVALTVIR